MLTLGSPNAIEIEKPDKTLFSAWVSPGFGTLCRSGAGERVHGPDQQGHALQTPLLKTQIDLADTLPERLPFPASASLSQVCEVFA